MAKNIAKTKSEGNNKSLGFSKSFKQQVRYQERQWKEFLQSEREHNWALT